MRKLSLISACISLSAAVAYIVVHFAGPSTAELNTDIKLAKEQLEGANTEALKYSSGLIVVEAQLRAAILNNTVAMLQQKRESYLRGLTIVYRDPVARVSIQDPDSAAELAKAEADVLAAQADAEQYSGGLIQSMALVRVATTKVTLASIQQRLELARSGIPLPMSSPDPTAKSAQPGKPASDKDAL